MKRVALIATVAALPVACAPPAPVPPPPSPEPHPPDCEAWKSGRFHGFSVGADADAVRSCLRAGADPNARDHDNRTPLHEAVGWELNLGVISALMAGGADTNALDWAGTTPLHDAARWRDLAIVTALIESGADVNARDANGRTPLHAALGNSDPAVARALLASGADPLARDDRDVIADPAHCEHWNTRWFAAAAAPETMARCIESGADVGALNEHGETPLIVAASHGRAVPAAALLDGGADANARDSESRTVLHHAVIGGSPEVVALLLEAGADVHARDDDGATPLILPKWQVRHGHATLSEPAVVDLLIGAGAEVKARDDDGWTALHAVASNPDAPNALQVAKRLLESGADPNAHDYWGGTPLPLALAVRGDNEALVRALLGAGADVAAGGRGESALHAAAGASTNPGVLVALLETGAEVNARDTAGATSLHRAAGAGASAAVVEVLLGAGADVAARDTAGNTPLHRAATGRSATNVDLLLAAGADVHARDHGGNTPLHILAMARATTSRRHAGPVAAALVRAGADMIARNDEGRTPLQAAFSLGHAHVVDELLELGADPEPRGTPEWDGGPTTCKLGVGDFLHSATAETLEECIDSGADVNARDPVDRTPLHYLAVAERSPPALVGMLADAGADIDARDDSGDTPLHMAMGAGRLAMAAALLEAGADVNAGSRWGGTPLHRAVERRQDAVELVSLLVGAGAIVDSRNMFGQTPLRRALDAGRPDIVDTLVQLGADPSILDDSGNVPDHTSCERWNTSNFFAAAGAEVVADCIRHGADVGARDDKGFTPLHLAARHNPDPAIVSALLEAGAEVNTWATGMGHHGSILTSAGADPNLRTDRGYTSLHEAVAANSSPDVVLALLEAGADVNAQVEGKTPLHMALEAAEPDVVEVLLERGAEVNAGADGGKAPLRTALWAADPDVVEMLLHRGAEANARWSDGATPLHEAAARGPPLAVVELLVQAGADLRAPGPRGRTPLHLAAWSPAKYQRLLQLGADPAALDDFGWTPLDYLQFSSPHTWLPTRPQTWHTWPPTRFSLGHTSVNPCRAVAGPSPL